MKINESNVLDWEFIVSRNLSFLHQWLSIEGHIKHARLFGCRIPIVHLSLHQGFQASLFLSRIKLEELINEYRRLFCVSKNRTKITNIYKKYGQRLHRVSKEINSLAPDDKQQTKMIKKYFDLYRIYTTGLNITTGAGKYLTDDIYCLLGKKYQQSEIGELVSILTFTNTPSPTQLEEIELLKLRVKAVAWSQDKIKKTFNYSSE